MDGSESVKPGEGKQFWRRNSLISIMIFKDTNRTHTCRENLETVNMMTVEMCAVTQVMQILLSEPKGAARLMLHHTD